VAARPTRTSRLTGRPAIRGIALDLIDRHPQLSNTRELRAVLNRPDDHTT
jgi:hypothetical protein